MRNAILLLTVLAFSAGGCKKGDSAWWKKKAPDGDAATATTAPELTPHEREVERLNEANRTLEERLAETTNRSNLLSKKVKQLEFVNDQLRKQLAAVGDAPQQRDQYKAKSERLDKHIKELELQLAELMKLRMAQPSRTPGG